MCGIAGFVNASDRPADPRLLRAMTDVLRHRGPDGGGYHVDGAVGLGHRRLAIIDLDTGAQPMGTDDGGLWITYNGEVYNYRELRTELIGRGIRFRTSSDTEVVLRAWEVYGPACLARLRGMFAFAIWDARARRLFLARDRFGIKPLVYGYDGTRFWFASELKAILQDPAAPRTLDWHALGEYLAYQYVPTPHTIFAGFRKLPAASLLSFAADTGAIRVTRYWTLCWQAARDGAEGEWIEELRSRLADAVRHHMVSDVPIGAFLSGGVDSSTVVALMNRHASPVRTFSIGSGDESGHDDLRHARAVATRYQTDHRELVTGADALAALPQLTWQLDEPFADASALPTLHVARIARQHVKVALSGDGGDEMFAGYARYGEAAALHARWDAPPLAWARPLLRAVSRRLPTEARGRRRLALLGAEPMARYFTMMTLDDGASLAGLLTDAARAELSGEVGAARFAALAGEAGSVDYVTSLQHVDTQTYLPDDILVKVDRMSMLASLETRVPLLDHPLVEFAASVPSALRRRGGEAKYLLKRAARPWLPDALVRRPKVGFGVPLGEWLRREPGLHAEEVLLDERTRRHGIVSPRAAARLLHEHRTGPRDRSAQIWALLCLELWCRTWWDTAPPASVAPPASMGAAAGW